MSTLAEVQAAVRRRFGAQLGAIERWSFFRRTESRDEWIKFLGLTAVVLTHQEHMVRVAEGLLKNESSVSSSEYNLLLLAFAIHDLGEMTVGDTPAPNKTLESDQEEFAAALVSLKVLSADLSEDPGLEQIYRDVVIGDNAVLHHLFRAIEITEYFMTALQGFTYLQEGGNATANKRSLVVAAVVDYLPMVLRFSQQYPLSIGSFLKENNESISTLIDVLKTWPESKDVDFGDLETAWTRFQAR